MTASIYGKASVKSGFLLTPRENRAGKSCTHYLQLIYSLGDHKGKIWKHHS